MHDPTQDRPIEPGKLLWLKPDIPKIALVRAARRWHQAALYEYVRDAVRAIGGDLIPSSELNWRQRMKTAGSIMIGRRAYHLIPPDWNQENGGRRNGRG